MLQEHRERRFFTADPDVVLETLEQFARAHGGRPQEGFRTLALFSFEPSIPHTRRFLNVALRDRSEADPRGTVQGNLTLRFREEPEGEYQQLARELLETLKDRFQLYDHPRAADSSGG